MSHLTAEEAAKIAAWQQIKNEREVKVPKSWMASALGRTRGTVARCIVRGSSSTTRKGRAAPAEIRRRNRLIVKLAKATRSCKGRVFPTYGSAPRISIALKKKYRFKCGARQVQRVLKASGLKPYKRQAVTTRSPTEVENKVRFANRVLRTWRARDYEGIIFSDETWLTCNEDTCATQYAKKKDDVYPLERKAKWNVPSLQVWCAMGVGYKSKLVIFPAKAPRNDDDDNTSAGLKAFRLNGAGYIRKCLSPHISEWKKRKNTIFMQDGARPHLPGLKYLDSKKVRVLRDWPSYTAECNMIEPVWKVYKRAVGEKCPMTLDELKRAAIAAWRELPQELLDRHALGFKKKLQGVVNRSRHKRS